MAHYLQVVCVPAVTRWTWAGCRCHPTQAQHQQPPAATGNHRQPRATTGNHRQPPATTCNGAGHSLEFEVLWQVNSNLWAHWATRNWSLPSEDAATCCPHLEYVQDTCTTYVLYLCCANVFSKCASAPFGLCTHPEGVFWPNPTGRRVRDVKKRRFSWRTVTWRSVTLREFVSSPWQVAATSGPSIVVSRRPLAAGRLKCNLAKKAVQTGATSPCIWLYKVVPPTYKLVYKPH